MGIYFVLAVPLFPGIGYLRVRDKMIAALEDLDLPWPAETARGLADVRGAVGPRGRSRGALVMVVVGQVPMVT